MDVRGFLRPTVTKIILTLLIPIPIYGIFTFRLDAVLDFYYYLLTPYIKTYTDVIYMEFNYFVLLWVPFYLGSCLIVEIMKRRG